MIVLGIESSCDETGVGIIKLSDAGHMEIIANSVASSMQQHARFGASCQRSPRVPIWRPCRR